MIGICSPSREIGETYPGAILPGPRSQSVVRPILPRELIDESCFGNNREFGKNPDVQLISMREEWLRANHMIY